jgi:hypothetical protein
MATAERGEQYVDWDILHGTLLVNGNPVGRLPDLITSHATYVRTFGQVVETLHLMTEGELNIFQRILDVIPSAVMGYDYSTRSCVQGYQVGDYSNTGYKFDVTDHMHRSHSLWEIIGSCALSQFCANETRQPQRSEPRVSQNAKSKRRCGGGDVGSGRTKAKTKPRVPNPKGMCPNR